jgi:ATP-dependent Clp protease ATP-binding subunit ClpX
VRKILIKCSFCHSPETHCDRIIAGPNIFICNKCIERFLEELEEEDRKNLTQDFKDLIPTPSDIYNQLSEYVIGQNYAKKVISVAAYNHYKRIFFSKHRKAGAIDLEKANILMHGPSGCGKTLLIKTLAKILKVPLSLNDATTLTEAGYVGDDVESVLSNLLMAANSKIELAERGICFIDEIDKIARKQESNSLTRDVSGEGVQQALLKLVEGTVANVPPRGGRKHPQQDFVKIDTKNILFIVAGAFENLDKIAESRQGTFSLGFKKCCNTDNGGAQPEVEDFIKFGLIPEFVGRFPILCGLDQLSTADLIRILTEPKDALLKQYEALLETEGVKLIWEPQALEKIASEALARGTGARGLRSILEDLFLDTFFELSDLNVEKVILSVKAVETRKLEYIFKYKAAAS